MIYAMKSCFFIIYILKHQKVIWYIVLILDGLFWLLVCFSQDETSLFEMEQKIIWAIFPLRFSTFPLVIHLHIVSVSLKGCEISMFTLRLIEYVFRNTYYDICIMCNCNVCIYSQKRSLTYYVICVSNLVKIINFNG